MPNIVYLVCVASVGLLMSGCDPGGVIIVVHDASVDSPACEIGNPGPVPCESAADCPVVPVGSCYHFECPFNDVGQSFCQGVVADGGP